MMRMVRAINETHLPDMGFSNSTVSCITCHNGKAVPLQLFDLIHERFTEDGLEAAVDLFRMLRDRHYGSSAYDFSEASVNRYARTLFADGHPEASRAFLDLNLEYFPE